GTAGPSRRSRRPAEPAPSHLSHSLGARPASSPRRAPPCARGCRDERPASFGPFGTPRARPRGPTVGRASRTEEPACPASPPAPCPANGPPPPAPSPPKAPALRALGTERLPEPCPQRAGRRNRPDRLPQLRLHRPRVHGRGPSGLRGGPAGSVLGHVGHALREPGTAREQRCLHSRSPDRD